MTEPTSYAITVTGHLDDHWAAWLGDHALTRNDDGTTTITAEVIDQAELHGILARVRDIGAVLIGCEAHEMVDEEGPRHSAGWYDQTLEWDELAAGDRMMIPCEGGPVMSRLEVFPPRLEIVVDGGTYVLEDDGPRPTWRYRFIVP